jgi:hypothetical protein
MFPAVKVAFEVDGRTAEFRRAWFSGRTYVVTDDGDEHVLMRRFRSSSVFYDMPLDRRWSIPYAGHTIEIETKRPWVSGAYRRCTIRVDGRQVADVGGF